MSCKLCKRLKVQEPGTHRRCHRCTLEADSQAVARSILKQIEEAPAADNQPPEYLTPKDLDSGYKFARKDLQEPIELEYTTDEDYKITSVYIVKDK